MESVVKASATEQSSFATNVAEVTSLDVLANVIEKDYEAERDAKRRARNKRKAALRKAKINAKKR
jgi:uncharacterized membrane protein YukC